jgi:hypothetical protein
MYANVKKINIFVDLFNITFYGRNFLVPYFTSPCTTIKILVPYNCGLVPYNSFQVHYYASPLGIALIPPSLAPLSRPLLEFRKLFLRLQQFGQTVV